MSIDDEKKTGNSLPFCFDSEHSACAAVIMQNEYEIVNVFQSSEEDPTTAKYIQACEKAGAIIKCQNSTTTFHINAALVYTLSRILGFQSMTLVYGASPNLKLLLQIRYDDRLKSRRSFVTRFTRFCKRREESEEIRELDLKQLPDPRYQGLYEKINWSEIDENRVALLPSQYP